MIHFLIIHLKIINIIPNLKDREIPVFLTGKWRFVPMSIFDNNLRKSQIQCKY